MAGYPPSGNISFFLIRFYVSNHLRIVQHKQIHSSWYLCVTRISCFSLCFFFYNCTLVRAWCPFLSENKRLEDLKSYSDVVKIWCFLFLLAKGPVHHSYPTYWDTLFFYKKPIYKKQGLKSANLTSKWGLFYISM